LFHGYWLLQRQARSALSTFFKRSKECHFDALGWCDNLFIGAVRDPETARLIYLDWAPCAEVHGCPTTDQCDLG
jgi:hypothetical protein